MNPTRRNGPWDENEAENPSRVAREGMAAGTKTWKLRFDGAALPGAEESLADRDVLSFFRKQLRPGADDGERRESARVPAIEREAWLGWWDDEEFLIAPALLDNISRGGVRLTTHKPIAVDQPCWLCLGPPSPVVCVRSLVLAISRGHDGFEVRLAFTMPCPEPLYDIVARGRPMD